MSEFNQPHNVSYQQKHPKGSNKKWLWVTIGIVSVCSLACCGGGLGFILWGFNMATHEARLALSQTQVIQQEIGEIEEFNVDLVKTGEVQGDVFAYKIKGPKGSGIVYVVDNMGPSKGWLIKNGQRYDFNLGDMTGASRAPDGAE